MSYDHHMAAGRRKRRPFDRLEESYAYYILDKETKEIQGEPFDTRSAASAEATKIALANPGTLEIVQVGTATISVDVVAVVDPGANR